jgi:hypothetical protein
MRESGARYAQSLSYGDTISVQDALIRAAALVGAAALCAWLICLWFDGATSDPEDLADQISYRGDRLAVRGDKLVVVRPALRVMPPSEQSGTDVALLDPNLSLGAPPTTFAAKFASIADDAAEQAAEAPAAAPVPQRQETPQEAPSVRKFRQSSAAAKAQFRTASLRPRETTDQTAAQQPAQEPSFFEKLFGKPSPLTLAYAAPDDGGLMSSQSLISRYDRFTAVYDISAHTVYMPDGTRLEAHSGLGDRLDDPRHPDEKMHGVTPPNIYDLEPRESPFHGVRALRLIPEDKDRVYGRSGLLAHSFMLGPNGQSNGCVSFRNYDAFLRAFESRQVKRLAVVTSLN